MTPRIISAKLEISSTEVGESFLHAVTNQYAFDSIYFLFFNKSIDEFNGIPRPAKWARKSKIFLWILKKSSKALQLGWMYFGAYVFFALKLFKYILRKKNFSCCPLTASDATLAIAICQRSCDVIDQAIPGSKKKIWLIPPLSKIVPFQGEDQENYFDALLFLSKRELLEAWVLACQLHNLIKRERDKNLSMQTYVALDWVIFLMAVKKIAPLEIITAEHHDRWAVLLDSYCSWVLNIGREINLVLVQHGKEHEETYGKFLKNSDFGSLSYKLRNVTQAYLYDAEQKDIFIRNIFLNNTKSPESIKVDYYTYKLVVYDTGLKGLVVLFVGHPSCEVLQKKIFEKILNKEKYHFLYKPHPTASDIKVLRKFNPGWTLLEDNLKYPKINFLISYPSTLVDEYQHIGVDSYIHPLGEALLDVNPVVEELNKKLGLLI